MQTHIETVSSEDYLVALKRRSNLKPTPLLKEIEKDDLCEICCIDIKNEKLACDTCNKTTCIFCLNNLKSRNFSLRRDLLDNTHTIIEYFEGSVMILFDCSFCRSKNMFPMERFNREELLKLILPEYILLFNSMKIRKMLNDQLEDAQYMNIQMESIFIGNEDLETRVKRLVNVNNELQETNKNLLESLTEKETELGKDFGHQVIISDLRKEILIMKENHIKELNIKIEKYNVLKAKMKVIKESKETKDIKETKDFKETKDIKETKDVMKEMSIAVKEKVMNIKRLPKKDMKALMEILDSYNK